MKKDKKNKSWLLKAINKGNDWVAIKITMMVSSIWAFYVFVIYGFAPLIWPQSEVTILYWSNFLQLIFLPVITVGATILGRDAEKRATQDHKHITKNFIMIQKMLTQMQDFHEIIMEHVNESGVDLASIEKKKKAIMKKSVEIQQEVEKLDKANLDKIKL